ncbi:MAG: type IV pilus modification protein PilV [Candidatus Competibacteraceae bacterium]
MPISKGVFEMNLNKDFMNHTQRGFTLLEVLVAVIVLAIGLLGMAALQLTATRYSHGSFMRIEATQLANEMADRMRANQTGVNNNNYSNVAIGSTVTDPGYDCETTYGGGTKCSSQEMANADIYSWKQDIGRLLPSGDGGVVCTDSDGADADPCTNGSMHTITIQWADSDLDNSPVTGTFSITLAP